MGAHFINWQAHEDAVIRVFPCGESRFLSISSDRTAAVWHIRGAEVCFVEPVVTLCALYNLDRRQHHVEQAVRETRFKGFSHTGSVTPSSAVVHQFTHQNATTRVLYAAAGHKIAVQKIPSDNSKPEIKLERSYFVDRNGVKISRQKLSVQSLVLLPLRKLMLLGTEDGLIRVST